MEGAEGLESQTNPVYVAQLSKHICQVRAHLSGSDGTGSISPSFFEPNAYWTSAEKDSLFHGLAIYSRIRPDLIATEVKTKTVSDVCVYLDMLEEGSTNNPYTSHRQDIPASVEVSDRWLAFEEQEALAICSAEDRLDDQALQKRRDEETRAYRIAIRARKGDARTASNERDRVGERRRRKEYKMWFTERQEEWKAEDILHNLDTVAMKALNHILRKDEDSRWPTGEESHMPITIQEKAVGAQGQQQGVYTPKPSDLVSDAVHTIDEEMIDPVLRALSEPVSMSDAPAPSTLAVVPAEMLPHFTSGHQFRPSSPPFQSTNVPSGFSRNSIAPDMTMAASTSTLPPPEEPLSPASRRRLQKRIYMRRKRAEKNGTTFVDTVEKLRPGRKRKKRRGEDDEGALDSHVVGGEPATPQNLSMDDGSIVHDAPGGDEDQSFSEDEDVDGAYRHSHPSGPTRYEKLLNECKAVGITAERLYEEGLGLLRLPGLAKLMRLYNDLHDVPPSVGSQVSADLIKILNAHVIKFTTQLAHRAIVSREQERLAKVHTKVWRFKNEIISPVNVDHALSLMCLKRPSKRAHFKRLLDRLDLEVDSASEPSDEEDDVMGTGRNRSCSERRQNTSRSDNSSLSSDDDDFSNEDDEAHDAKALDSLDLSVHQSIFAPFVRLPSSASTSSIGYAAPIDPSLYMPWPASTPLSNSVDPLLDEELLPEDTDNDALLAELLEEEAIEEQDKLEDEAHEKSMWAKFSSGSSQRLDAEHGRRKRKRAEDVSDVEDDDDHEEADEDHAERALNSLRYRQPDPSGPIKSQVYIDDSD